MKNIQLYKIRLKSKNERAYILDIEMDDKLKSHRYYFIHQNEKKYSIERIKSIFSLLEDINEKGIRLQLASDKCLLDLLKILDITPVYKKIKYDYTKNTTEEIGDYDHNILKKIKYDNTKGPTNHG